LGHQRDRTVWQRCRPGHFALTPDTKPTASRRPRSDQSPSQNPLCQPAPQADGRRSPPQATPPSHTAKSHRQVTPPSHTAKQLRQPTPPTQGRQSESANRWRPTLPARNLLIIAPECVYQSGVNPHRHGGSPPNSSANRHRQPKGAIQRPPATGDRRTPPGTLRFSHRCVLIGPG
jgi:hypothetical protein